MLEDAERDAGSEAEAEEASGAGAGFVGEASGSALRFSLLSGCGEDGEYSPKLFLAGLVTRRPRFDEGICVRPIPAGDGAVGLLAGTSTRAGSGDGVAESMTIGRVGPPAGAAARRLSFSSASCLSAEGVVKLRSTYPSLLLGRGHDKLQCAGGSR